MSASSSIHRVSSGIKHPLRPLFFASFFFSFHIALLSYLNSSVLGTHASSLQTTLAYIGSSALSLILIFVAPLVVRKLGASRFLVLGLVLSMGLLSVLGLVTERIGFVGVFMLYFSLNTVIWYAFDLCIEHYSRESNTGNIRGLYLNINNFGWVLAPMAASAVALKLGFTGTYLLASGAVLVALVIIVCTTRIKHSAHAPKLHLHQAFAELVKHAEARRLVSLYFVLQFFFALMVIYMVPYLVGVGFDLKSIGIILSIMLLPFVILQYAVGKMADRHRNEKALIVLGFCIMGLSTLLLALPDSFIFGPTLGFFAAVLFLTRVGASIIEVGVESKFFKVVTEKDTALISTLRMTLPLAYIIAPLVGALILVGGSMQSLFAILGLICLGAMLYAFRLKNH